jgi:hypothetical protein
LRSGKNRPSTVYIVYGKVRSQRLRCRNEGLTVVLGVPNSEVKPAVKFPKASEVLTTDSGWETMKLAMMGSVAPVRCIHCNRQTCFQRTSSITSFPYTLLLIFSFSVQLISPRFLFVRCRSAVLELESICIPRHLFCSGSLCMGVLSASFPEPTMLVELTPSVLFHNDLNVHMHTDRSTKRTGQTGSFNQF